MIKAQIHRGPDFSDYLRQFKSCACLQLSIQDLSNNANQPMVSANKNVIVFMGKFIIIGN